MHNNQYEMAFGYQQKHRNPDTTTTRQIYLVFNFGHGFIQSMLQDDLFYIEKSALVIHLLTQL
jgi:hypothetical protein